MKITVLERLFNYVDIVNEKVGLSIRFLLLPLAGATLTEVIARYFFNKPTIWAWDTNLQIFGAVILLGAGYTLLHNRHIAIEAVTEHLPPRGKLALEMVAMLMVMFVAAIIVWQGGIEGWDSFIKKEKLNTLWAPPIFPIKMLYPIAGALLLFQALAKFIRDLSKLVMREA